MSESTGRVAELSAERRLLIELLRREKQSARGAVGPSDREVPELPPFALVADADRARLPEGLEDAYPLTRMQAGMIFHMELTPDYPLYHNVDSWHLRARFVVEHFQQAVQRAVARHAVLRTAFDLGSFSEPLQLVHRKAVLEVGVDDLRGRGAAGQDAEIKRFVEAEKRRRFDLSRPPLLRFHVHVRTDESFQFTLTEFHPILDGWSLQSTLTDIVRDYSALLRGEAPAVEPPLAVRFRDFVDLEQQALRSVESRAFWREKLRGITVLQLPRWPGAGTDLAERPYVRVQIPLSPGTFDGLRALSQRAGVPLKSLFLAAHCKMLGAATGLGTIVTGLIVHGRPEGPDGDRVRGLFLNTAPLRLDLISESWEDLARRAFEAERELLPHRRFPFAEIKNLAGREDLLETALNVTHFHVTENVARSDFEVATLAGSRELEETSFALLATFGIDPTGKNLQLLLQADRARVADDHLEQISGRFAAILEAMAERPAERHDATDLLTAPERAALLAAAPLAVDRLPRVETLAARIGRVARETPHAVAVVCGDRALSYGELWRRAGRFAAALAAAGCGAESRVGVLLERSLEMVAAIVGVLRVGAAYVPLDPAYPAERLSFLLDDARVAAVVAPDEHAEAASGRPRIDVRSALAADREELELGESATTGESDLDPAQAAYVIYTSGSTGRPKGVVVSHENVSRLFDATAAWFAFDRRDVWSLFHSFAFDFSVWEIFGALLYGGRLVVVPRLVARETEAFHRLLADERVTFLNQTPSAFRQLLAIELQAPAYELALREVVFGGEALDLASLAPWFAHAGARGPRLVNMYGITETTVHVTFRALDAASLGARSLVGAAIPDLVVRLFDRSGNLAAIGVPGEIHVGGRGLARGYLGRPDLTAERFVPDPFAGVPGARLYRSGDLARRLPDGDLEYLGRADHQVKVRGFRIEPGEIEAALSSHPDVRGALVAVHRVAAGDDRLVAWIETDLAAADLVEALRGHLRRQLPDYMIPALVVPVPAFPLTAHGKIDRAALPAPDFGAASSGAPYEAPRTVIEEILAAVWSEVLHVERVGVRDNFFALGGDSIRILQVLTKARQRGLRLELQQFYEHETLADLATAIAERLRAEEADDFVAQFAAGADDDGDAIRTAPFELISAADRERLPDGIEDAYPLTRMQAGMIFHMQLTPELPLYHNVDSMHLAAHFEEAPFRRAVARAVARHAVLRTSFHLTGYSEPLQLVHREATLEVGVEDVSSLAPAEQDAAIHAYVEAERRRTFDLTVPPLLRFQIHVRGDGACQFTLTECHPILDGWSLQSTLNEIVESYTAYRESREPATPPAVALTFRDYVALERRAVQSEAAQTFWRQTLAGATALRMPRSPEAPGESAPRRFADSLVPLNRHLLALRDVARELGVPLKSVVLAVHCKVIGMTAGVDDVVTGLLVHGRPEGGGAEEIRGLFLNTLPLRLDIAVASWRELVRAAFAAERALVPHRRFPLAEIQRSWGREALLETGANFTHFHVHRGGHAHAREAPVALLGGRVHNETNFPFSVNFGVDPWGTQLLATLAADLRFVVRPQLEQLARRYEAAIEALAADPAADPRSASLLAAAERQQLLVEWNDTALARPPSPLVHRLFEARAAAQPDAVAMVAPGLALTYGGLDALADRMAARLRSAGAGIDDVVALCADRSPELIAAALAVLKAGAAYLPLDPAMPAERLAGILADSGARLVVGTTADELEAIRGSAGALALGDLAAAAQVPVDAGPRRDASADALCYLIYTSGSTGAPKGTLLAHEGLAIAASSLDRALRLGPGRRMLQFSSFAFDAAATEIWVALLAGAELHFAPAAELLSSKGLAAVLAEREITSAVVPPSVLLALRPQPLPALEVLTAVGEACPEALIASWGAGRRFVNGYGPTEITMGCTVSYDHRPGAKPAIGRPLANRQAYVVDRALRLAPPLAPGELLIGGIGLARGYLGLPAMTAERFIPDPFSGRSGARLYRTGDVARLLPDGALDFLGRVDRQVKVRGFRVEPGEIEAALVKHPAVAEAAVVAFGERPGDTRLVAYLAPVAGVPVEELSIAEVRAFLRGVLPEYMVPNAWTKLAELPHTTSGKVDRRALPPPEASREGSSFLPPRNELERQLAEVWREELQIEQVGVEDNIFDLGGHSLMMIRLHSRLLDLGFELSITHLFQYPSVATLAEFLSGGGAGAAAEEGESRAEQRRSASELRDDLRQRRRRARAVEVEVDDGEGGLDG